MDENIESALSYILGPFTGIFFLVTERENKTVKFHAMQSTIFIGGLMALDFVSTLLFSRIPLIEYLAALATWALGIVMFVSVVYLAYMAYQGKTFKVPYIGDSVWNNVNK
jgi:uncharacterized membrane protein